MLSLVFSVLVGVGSVSSAAVSEVQEGRMHIIGWLENAKPGDWIEWDVESSKRRLRDITINPDQAGVEVRCRIQNLKLHACRPSNREMVSDLRSYKGILERLRLVRLDAIEGRYGVVQIGFASLDCDPLSGCTATPVPPPVF